MTEKQQGDRKQEREVDDRDRDEMKDERMLSHGRKGEREGREGMTAT